jgi:exodeoxyribonuclease V alpha subunit
MTSITSSKFAAIIEAARFKKLDSEAKRSSPSQESNSQDSKIVSTDSYGHSIIYNSLQQEFISLSSSGQSCILIGAAGTGKTTCMKGAVQALSQHSQIKLLKNHDHKYLPENVPGIVVCAYTRRATNNIRRNMHEGMKANCITIHKLLEYAPQYYESVNDDGESKTTMKFEPSRNQLNPLPTEISCIIFEESSMIGTELYNEVMRALSHDVQIIFLGDIQQLPPVFGSAILGFKMLELSTVELTKVYRQALESPIISLAHRVLSGIPIKECELKEWNKENELKIIPWKKKIEAEAALQVTEKFFIAAHNSGEYNPLEDMILIPFNKSYGTLELNKSIANNLAQKESRIVYEVVAGFLKHYFSVGDKVLYDREDALILSIEPNLSYSGVPAQKESAYLDYWGHNNTPAHLKSLQDSSNMDDMDFILSQVVASDEDKVTQSSHTIKLLMQDSGSEKVINKAAEINTLLLGYALTIHKAQGSEWEKVFLLLHNSHATMLSRELLYTAVTRAKKSLTIICEGDTFIKGITSQRIKGNTLAEKAEYFKGKINSGDLQS